MRFVWVVLLLAAGSSACATALPPDRRQRLSDCVAACETGREPPRTGVMGQPVGSGMANDTRTDCEKRCQ
jgi:hypothetical protein